MKGQVDKNNESVAFYKEPFSKQIPYLSITKKHYNGMCITLKLIIE